MKPYFAKYLPVEGETKKGDKFNSINGELPGSQHVRLFLCSRDIQIGDTIDCSFTIDDMSFQKKGQIIQTDEIEGSVYTLKVEDSYFESGFAREWIPKEYAFKVIGEISPKATWVKEGDEFDYGEVRIIRSCEKGNECDLHFGAQSCTAPHSLIDPINIKGPCGHFH